LIIYQFIHNYYLILQTYFAICKIRHSSSSNSFERTLCNSHQYLNGHLGTYCLEFILSLPIISIFSCYTIYFASTRRFNYCRNRQTFQTFRRITRTWRKNWFVLRIFNCNTERFSIQILYITCDCSHHLAASLIRSTNI
jgi:hypothetical protein